MNHSIKSLLILFLVLGATSHVPAAEKSTALAPGAGFTINGQPAVLARLDSLPLVDDQYTRRFKFDTHDNPKLKQLRERYRLDEVIAPGAGEFDRQVLLLDWVNKQFKSFGSPSSKARGAIDVLQACSEGHTFFCAHYADVMVSTAASMGWICRPLALRRPDHIGQGSTEHAVTEIWSNQHRKWVLFDPTFAMYVEKNGVPVNAYELRQEWFHNAGRDLVFILDKERKRYRRSDLPVFRNRYPGFGDLSLDDSALNVYAFIGYIPNTNIMDAGLDYGQMFITQDQVGGSTKWHRRVNPADPARDPYFPINQAAIELRSDGGALLVQLRTLTPNFKSYVARTAGGEWKPVSESFPWELRPGVNRLEVKTVNHYGVDGPISTAEVNVGTP